MVLRNRIEREKGMLLQCNYKPSKEKKRHQEYTYNFSRKAAESSQVLIGVQGVIF